MKNKESLKICPLCKGESWAHYLDCKDYTVSLEVFRLMQCNGCSLVATSPRPAPEDLGGYYASEDYISHTESKKGLINRIYLMARKYALGNKKRLINREMDRRGNLLDYGCGTGAFLHSMAEDGWQVQGIEPDEQARAIAEKRNGQKIQTPSDLSGFAENSFDVITLWHVLEHVYEPLELCKEFFRILKPGGKLYLALPNHLSQDARKYRGAWAAYDVPRHLFHFNRLNINDIRKKSGFTDLKVLPMKMDAFYISWLSEKYLGNSLAPLGAFISGLKSNYFAAQHPEKGYSSQLYVLSK